MSYSLALAELLTEQLRRLHSLNHHQLAGQFANLDFWVEEVKHSFAVIDGYRRRFDALRSAQEQHVALHRTIEFSVDDPCCTETQASPPQRVPDRQLRAARQSVGDAAYRLLIRCHKERFVDEETVRKVCEELGISVETSDFRHRARR